MPTYQYACTACDHRFDAVQSFSDDALTECPECGGRLRKLYGAVGVVFKGSGFYRTDSRSDSKATKPAEKKDKKSEPAPSGSSTSGSSSPASDSTPAVAPKSGAKAASSSAGSAA